MATVKEKITLLKVRKRYNRNINQNMVSMHKKTK